MLSLDIENFKFKSILEACLTIFFSLFPYGCPRTLERECARSVSYRNYRWLLLENVRPEKRCPLKRKPEYFDRIALFVKSINRILVCTLFQVEVY